MVVLLTLTAVLIGGIAGAVIGLGTSSSDDLLRDAHVIVWIIIGAAVGLVGVPLIAAILWIAGRFANRNANPS